jgi:hypothetical protein
MKDVSLKTILHTIGVGTAVGLYIWSDKLTSPIKGKDAKELSSEMAHNIGSMFVKTIKDAFEQPYQIDEKSYSFILNLAIPCIFLAISLGILSYISWGMILSFNEDKESKVDYYIKIILSIALVLSTVLVLIKFGQLLLLNVIVGLSALFILALIISGFASLVNKERLT